MRSGMVWSVLILLQRQKPQASCEQYAMSAPHPYHQWGKRRDRVQVQVPEKRPQGHDESGRRCNGYDPNN